MDQRHRGISVACLAAVFWLGVSVSVYGQSLPEGQGKAEFQRICSSCHAAAMATRLSKTPDDWKGVVNDMISRGAQGSQEDMDKVVLYLSTNFGPNRSTAMPATPSPVQAAAPGVTLSSTEIDRGKKMIAENGCIACHRVGNEGSYLGPSLDEVGSRRKPDEIRASIVSPQPKVQPDARQVRLVRRDGKTIVGKILNQDGYSVQIVDATGQLATYSKSGLREFTIVDANPMPSFGNKITGQDLDDLVHYLSSLTEPGK